MNKATTAILLALAAVVSHAQEIRRAIPVHPNENVPSAARSYTDNVENGAASADLIQETRQTQPWFTVVISDGWIDVCTSDAKQKVLGSMKTEDWAAALDRSLPVTRDDRRHFALNAVAAWIAGDGGREHTVDPREQIVTLDEAKKNGWTPTMTIEQGVGFIILRDTEPKAATYRAQIIMVPPDAIKTLPQPAPPPLPAERQAPYQPA